MTYQQAERKSIEYHRDVVVPHCIRASRLGFDRTGMRWICAFKGYPNAGKSSQDLCFHVYAYKLTRVHVNEHLKT